MHCADKLSYHLSAWPGVFKDQRYPKVSIQCLNQNVLGLYFAGLETKFNLTLNSMISLIGFQNANKDGYTCS